MEVHKLVSDYIFCRVYESSEQQDHFQLCGSETGMCVSQTDSWAEFRKLKMVQFEQFQREVKVWTKV